MTGPSGPRPSAGDPLCSGRVTHSAFRFPTRGSLFVSEISPCDPRIILSDFLSYKSQRKLCHKVFCVNMIHCNALIVALQIDKTQLVDDSRVKAMHLKGA